MPNRQTKYGLRSNIPQLTGQALLATCFNVLEPVIMPVYERRRYGSQFSRNVFQEYDDEKLQQFAFTSESYFPALTGYVDVPRLNNAPAGPDGSGDPITFTMNKVFEDDLKDPADGLVLDFTHLVIENITIIGYEPNEVQRGNASQEWRLTGIVRAWKKYWNRQIIADYSQRAERLHTYIPDGSTPPNWTLVDHLKPVTDALNASVA